MESSREAAAFVESAAISEGDKEKILHANAERLFGL
jgi:predicted TIM-barrel fold metal-dependent hydrolase